MTAPAEVAMTAEEQEAWLAFGRRVAAAGKRDLEDERPSIGTGRLVEFLELFLKSWFDGSCRVSFWPMQNWLTQLTYEVQPHMVNEQATARSWLSLEARLWMRDELARSGGREVSFVLSCDLEKLVRGEQPIYSNPKVLVRGNQGMTLLGVQLVMDELGDFRLPLVVHNHPSGDISPSDADLDLLGKMVGINRSIGYGIISQDADRLYMCYEPRFINDQYELAQLAREAGIGA